jgi:hypothetical protein
MVRLLNEIVSGKQQISLLFNSCSFDAFFTFDDQFFHQYSNIFQSIHTLLLPYDLASDTALESLEGLHSLKLSLCSTIKDPSFLKNIKILGLSGCTNLTNHNVLKNCQELNVSYTTIEDMSELVHVNKLILANCRYLPTQFPLMKNKLLELPMSTYISNPGNLGNVYKLDYFSQISINDFSGFSSVLILDLTGIRTVTKSLPVQNKLQSIVVEGDKFAQLGIHNFTLKQKRSLQLDICFTLPESTILTGFEKVTLSHMKVNSDTLIKLGSVTNLLLNHCEYERSLTFDRKPEEMQYNLSVLTFDCTQFSAFDDVLFPFLSCLSFRHCSPEYGDEQIIQIFKPLKEVKLVRGNPSKLSIFIDIQSLLTENPSPFPIHLHGAQIKALKTTSIHPIYHDTRGKVYSISKSVT